MTSPSRLPSVRRPAGRSGRPMSMVEAPTPDLRHESIGLEAPTSKQAKRRSLLPQFARKLSAEHVEQTREDDNDGESHGTTTSVTEETQEVDRPAMPPPSRLSRPTSVYRIGGLGRAASVRSHIRDIPQNSREAALAALNGTGPSPAARARTSAAAGDAVTKRMSTARLPQIGSRSPGIDRAVSARQRDSYERSSETATAPSETEKRSSRSSTQSTSSTSTTATSEMRPPRSSIQPTASHPRASRASAAGSDKRPMRTTRPLSMHVSSAPPVEGAPVSPASSTASAPRHLPARSLMAPPSRPGFSTYQQHYSPAKSALPKPPVPSVRSSRPQPSVPAEDDVPITLEVQRLQIELLQLSLLREAADETLRAWDGSARRKLDRRQATLRRDYDVIRHLEDDQRRVANLAILDEWCPDLTLLVENLLVLGNVHAEVTALVEEGGRYGHVIDGFEQWSNHAEEVFSGTGDVFVEAPPQEWTTGCTALTLRLRTLQREMDSLPPAPKSPLSSPLATAMSDCSVLLVGMLKELETMGKLVRDILAGEDARVEREVKALGLGLASAGKAAMWVPAWGGVAG